MTSILEKIGKAIDCSRRASDLVITEDQQATSRKLFISGTMDNDTLQLWGEVTDADSENLRITFVDDSRDDIHPAQGIPGQKHFITIISDEIPGILRLFTPEGWRTFLRYSPDNLRHKKYHQMLFDRLSSSGYYSPLDLSVRRQIDRRTNEALGITRLPGVIEMFRQ